MTTDTVPRVPLKQFKRTKIIATIGPAREKTVSTEITAPPGVEVSIEFLAESGSFADDITWYPHEPLKFSDTYTIPDVFIEKATDQVWILLCNLANNECVESEHVYAFSAE